MQTGDQATKQNGALGLNRILPRGIFDEDKNVGVRVEAVAEKLGELAQRGFIEEAGDGFVPDKIAGGILQPVGPQGEDEKTISGNQAGGGLLGGVIFPMVERARAKVFNAPDHAGGQQEQKNPESDGGGTTASGWNGRRGTGRG